MVENAIESTIQPVKSVFEFHEDVCEEEEADKVVEEKMLLDIAHILGTSMEGRIGDIWNYICEMLHQEKEVDKNQEITKKEEKNKKHKGSWISWLHLLIMIDRLVRKKLGVKLIGL